MLKRKLWRDIKGNYGAYLACISVLIIGLMLYVSFSLTLDSLNLSKDSYYQEYKFADGFAQIIKGPVTLADDIKEVKGIDQAEGRVVKNVLVHKPSGEEITALRLVSFTKNQSLNKFKLEEGKVPSEEGKELLVTPAFLEGNGYEIGDKIPLIIQGQEVKFTITGTANSPEYIYEIPNGVTLAPNPKTFGVAFVPYQAAASLFGMEEQINDLVFTLDKGVEFSAIEKSVTNRLSHYGLSSIYPRKDQLSNSMLEQELVGLEASAKTTPVIFLLVAASILYIMLRRMVEQQRGQVGVLKAFGFSDREILGHYLGYSIVIGGLGGLGGGLAGSGLSFYLVQIYQQYFNIPNLTGRFSLTYLAAGTLLSLVFSLFAGYRGCRQVLTLSPAEAMRPASPKTVRKTLVERIHFFWEFLSTQGKMAVRNVFRSKQRTFLAIFGIASAFSMMVASGASFDATYYLVSFQFDQVEKYDFKVSLNRYTDKNQAVTDSQYIDGVKKAEPMLEVPVTISNKWLEKDIALTGLHPNASLYHLLTKDGESVGLPSNGLVISTQLAKLLDIEAGDVVTIKPYLGERKERQVVVQKIVPQYVGLGAYMEIDALSKLLQMPSVSSSVLLQVDKDRMNDVRQELQEGKNVAGIYDKTKMKSQFEELMASTKASQFILIFFAFLTGFAIVYNVNIISLSERERELATLMVLGMTEREVAWILFLEQSFLGVLALIVGVPLSYGMLYAIVNGAANEIYNMPLIINPATFIISLIGTIAFLVAAQWKIRGKIGKLSMLDVLKEHE